MTEFGSHAALQLSFYQAAGAAGELSVPAACAATGTPQAAGIFLSKLENDFMWSA